MEAGWESRTGHVVEEESGLAGLCWIWPQIESRRGIGIVCPLAAEQGWRIPQVEEAVPVLIEEGAVDERERTRSWH